ncbi:MAG: hypothetical protein KDA47_19270, partial [Planctomycetales bacterium]|nr:hypothetical protein [Planctomycetales bacterium]
MKRTPHTTASRLTIFILLSGVLPNAAALQAWDDRGPMRPDAGLKNIQPDGIQGTLILAGGETLPEPAVAAFVSTIGDQATALVIAGDADESKPAASKSPAWMAEAGVPHTLFA